MKNFKISFCLLFIPFIVACEPEVLPIDTEIQIHKNVQIFSETGDQKDKPPVKTDDD